MRTRSQPMCAFSPDGAKKKPRDGPAEKKNAQDPGDVFSGEMCTISQFEDAFFQPALKKKNRGRFRRKTTGFRVFWRQNAYQVDIGMRIFSDGA